MGDAGAPNGGSKHVKLRVEGEGEGDALGETGTGKRAKRFQMPDVPRWWEAKIICYAFAHPRVRARLEKLMSTNVVQLTSKVYMQELEDRIREVSEENLDKRVSNRVLDEMERLKRLILIGKTKLRDCPPELYYHPVFVFWRKVNVEVAKVRRQRLNEYLKKLKGSQKIDQAMDEDELDEAEEEMEIKLTSAELLEKCAADLEAQKEEDIQNGFRFGDEEFAMLRFENNDVKTLKTLTTVEEIYTLSDRIVGNKRL